MEQLMKRAIDGLDVDYAEIRVEQGERTSLAYQGADLEEIGPSFVRGGCVRVCVRGGWGFAAFSDPDEARTGAIAAADMARLAGRDRTVLAPVDPVVASVTDDADINPADISLEDKHDLVRRYNEGMLHEPGIVTTSVRYRDDVRDIWLHTSEGTMLHRRKIRCGVSLMAVARDGANVQRGFKSFGDTRGYGTVLDREDAVAQVVKIARDLILAEKVRGGTYTVILDPQLSGVFAHEAFGHLSEADFISENPQAQEMMRLGRRFGPDFLNILDDGSRPGEAGNTRYDDEGVPGRKTHLIRDGLLVGRLHSRETAGLMGESPTGNARAITTAHRPIVRMTTTYIDQGENAFSELLENIDEGIYACGYLGGNTDLERFTFSSAYAFRIEKGTVTVPLRDVILSGNVFETMNHITGIADDLTLFGGLGGCGKNGQSPLPVSDGSPHIRIEKVLVG